MVFQGQKLEKGWLVVGVESADTPMVNWVMRERQDCVDDVKALARDLRESMRQRYANVPSYLEDLHNAFDLEELFTCLVGERNSSGKVILDEIKLEMKGKEMFAKFCKYCAALPHIRKAIQEEDLEFFEELSHVYHRQFKQAIKNHLWNANKGNERVGSIGQWFLIKPPQKKGVNNSEKYDLLSSRYSRFRIESLKMLPQDDDASRCRLHTEFLLRISSSKDELLVRVNEEAIVKSMYTESSLYEAIGRQYMIMFDIAQAKGCPEAIAESYYSCLDSQKMKGGQSTDSLSTRSKIAWCMPNAMRNQRAVKEITKAFLEKHKKPVFSAIKKTSYSQTLDRLAKEDAKISFLI